MQAARKKTFTSPPLTLRCLSQQGRVSNARLRICTTQPTRRTLTRGRERGGRGAKPPLNTSSAPPPRPSCSPPCHPTSHPNASAPQLRAPVRLGHAAVGCQAVCRPQPRAQHLPPTLSAPQQSSRPPGHEEGGIPSPGDPREAGTRPAARGCAARPSLRSQPGARAGVVLMSRTQRSSSRQSCWAPRLSPSQPGKVVTVKR